MKPPIQLRSPDFDNNENNEQTNDLTDEVVMTDEAALVLQDKNASTFSVSERPCRV